MTHNGKHNIILSCLCTRQEFPAKVVTTSAVATADANHSKWRQMFLIFPYYVNIIQQQRPLQKLQSTSNMLWFVQLEFTWDVWHDAHWGKVTKTKSKNNLFKKPKKSGHLEGKRKLCGSAAARMLGSQVRIPLRAGIFVSLLCFLCCASCRELPLRRADHSFRGFLPGVARVCGCVCVFACVRACVCVCVCVCVCELKTSTARRPRPELGCCVKKIA